MNGRPIPSILALILLGCRPAAEAPVAPPVVIVSIDTLRSDRLPVYGYEGGATPAIDALRRDGILVERAYTHAPLTLPAHASLFTGLLPPQHGVRDNSGYRLDERHGAATLPARLRAAGYATGAAVSAYVLRSETGIAAGFDAYDDAIDLGTGPGLAEQQRAGSATLRDALPWLRQAAARGPFLYFLHLYEPHAPYTPPEPHRSRFEDPYDGEIAAADAVVGELIDVLRELDVYDRSLIVVLSDHGEGLGDHGEDEHGILLYREALQIPLLLKLPGNARAGEALASPAQLVDVLPTVLDVVGLEVPEDLVGRSLVAPAAERDARRAPPIYAETYYPRLHHGWSELRSAIAADLHYIDGPDPELYRLSDDPQERHNLAAAEPRAAAALAEAIARAGAEPEPPAAEDAETRRRLEALGYLSSPPPGPGAGARGAGATLADPKSQLPVLRLLDAARRSFEAGDAASAERDLRRLVEAQPGMIDAWETLGDVLESAGRFEDALAARRRAVETSGGAPEQLLKIAPLLLGLGRVEEAREHARLAVDAFPSTAHTVLARVAMASGDLDTALLEAQASVAARAGTVTPILVLVEVLAARGDIEGALRAIESAEEEILRRGLPDPRPFLLRAEILIGSVDRGGALDAPRAASALETAARQADRLLALHPESPVGHAALARVPGLALELALHGRTAEAARVVEPLARRGDPAATRALAMTFTDGGDHEGARGVLEARLALAPDDAPALETLGLVELRMGRPDAAARHLERATALAPQAANAWNLLGVARWQGARDGAGAIDAWERALTLDPEQWEALQNVATVALETGRLKLAREALTRFVAQAPPERHAEDLARSRRLLDRLPPAGGR